MEKILDILIEESKKSLKSGDVPVAAIITENGKIISKAHNIKEKKQQPTKHAEIVAIEKACKRKKSWRLENCEIYITMEPCQMCLGAITQARIKKINYILTNKKYMDIQIKQIKNTKISKINNSLYNEKMKNIIKNFFEDKRK